MIVSNSGAGGLKIALFVVDSLSSSSNVVLWLSLGVIALQWGKERE